jgi:hypothetical protein
MFCFTLAFTILILGGKRCMCHDLRIFHDTPLSFRLHKIPYTHYELHMLDTHTLIYGMALIMDNEKLMECSALDFGS